MSQHLVDILTGRADRMEGALTRLALTPQELIEGLTVLRARLTIQHGLCPIKADYVGAMQLADDAAFDMCLGVEAIRSFQERKS